MYVVYTTTLGYIHGLCYPLNVHCLTVSRWSLGLTHESDPLTRVHTRVTPSISPSHQQCHPITSTAILHSITPTSSPLHPHQPSPSASSSAPLLAMSQKGVPPRTDLPTPTARIHTGQKRVVFCYDLVCPYAYIASCLIEQLAHDYSAKVEFHPVLLSGLMALDAATRQPDAPQVEVIPAKAEFKRASLMREAARHQVKLSFPAHHPVRTVAAMRVLSALEGAERVKLTHALYKAYWVEGKDVSNESVIMECITQCDIKAVHIDSQSSPTMAFQLTLAVID